MESPVDADSYKRPTTPDLGEQSQDSEDHVQQLSAAEVERPINGSTTPELGVQHQESEDVQLSSPEVECPIKRSATLELGDKDQESEDVQLSSDEVQPPCKAQCLTHCRNSAQEHEPGKLQLEVERPAANEAIIKWASVPDADTYKVTTKSDTVYISTPEIQVSECCRKLSELTLGQKYNVVVMAQEDPSLKNDFVRRTIQQGTIEFRTEFTQAELNELFEKAIKFMKVGSSIEHDEITWLYRDKSHAYMNNILENKGGIMEVYMKDNNGDAASIINGQIKGLFFASFIRTGTGKPSSDSVFGPSRLYLPSKVVLGRDDVRLYFADFYCINRRHHATVVLTHRGSEQDNFCSGKLIELNRHSNDFLWIERYTDKVMVACQELFVEVLYTENVNIHEWEKNHQARRETVPIRGRGSSTPGGLRKNSSCTKCNLNSVLRARYGNLFSYL